MKHKWLSFFVFITHFEANRSLVVLVNAINAISEQHQRHFSAVFRFIKTALVITNVTIRSVKLSVAIREHNFKHLICSEKVSRGIFKRRFVGTVIPVLEIRYASWITISEFSSANDSFIYRLSHVIEENSGYFEHLL